MFLLNNNFWVFYLIIHLAKSQERIDIQEVKTCASGSAVLKIPMPIQSKLWPILWTKDGDTLAIESRHHINASALTIVDATPKDGGIYCAQLLTHERSFQFYFKLIIADSRLTSFTPPKVIAAVGSNVTIKIEAKGHGNSAWTFNGDFLNANAESNHFKFLDPRDFDIINGGVLFIQNIQKRHSGVYLMAFNVQGCETTVTTQVEVFFTKLGTINDRKSEELIYDRILSVKSQPMFKTSVGMIVIIIAIIAVTAGVSSLITLWCLGLCKLLKKHWLKKNASSFSREISKEHMLKRDQLNEVRNSNTKINFNKSATRALLNFGIKFNNYLGSVRNKLNNKNQGGYKILDEEVDSDDNTNVQADINGPSKTNSFHNLSFTDNLDSSHINTKHDCNNNKEDKDQEKISCCEKKKLVKISSSFSSFIQTNKKKHKENIFNTIR
ncbi:uncharacterized protein LOC124810025 [Hydra vulgaris]|uniref:uncharacterized protein LOC124810025 n=1 Tax=Hydra vulgaris TaxID=6087 RepID=UPI0032EA1188